MLVDLDASCPIQASAFNQILELDDDDSFTYSKDMVNTYFRQVPTAFAGMQAALFSGDLRQLADLAHFLVGSSASLGVGRVAQGCEKIEEVGQDAIALAKADASSDKTTTDALDKIGGLLEQIKREFDEAQTWLTNWYREHGESFDEEDERPRSESVDSTTDDAEPPPPSPAPSNNPARRTPTPPASEEGEDTPRASISTVVAASTHS
ncbi:signal transduction histidine kinase [Roridomyces roridus]|uniref:Signal transduction histidine kinase n=1 Tax=Roridomyces roridus TaxID=1738132 RepID=A0AAD7CBN5_9AGAR|nr:signal transduction histidine kinase [Roridomyces roridus]